MATKLSDVYRTVSKLSGQNNQTGKTSTKPIYNTQNQTPTKSIVSDNNNGTLNGIVYQGRQKSNAQNNSAVQSNVNKSTGSMSNPVRSYSNSSATYVNPASSNNSGSLNSYNTSSLGTSNSLDRLKNLNNLSSSSNSTYTVSDGTNRIGNNYTYGNNYSQPVQGSISISGYENAVKDVVNAIKNSTNKVATPTYDKNTDYSILIAQAINRGASADEIRDLVAKRTQKIFDSGDYTLLNDATMQEAADYINYQDMIETAISNAENQTKADEEALLAAIESGKVTLEQGKQSIEKAYQEAAKQAYLVDQVSKMNLPDQLSTLGLGTTGYLPKIYGDISGSYGNALSAATSTKNQGIQDIDNQIAQLVAEGNLDVAQLKTDSAKTLADRLYEIANNQQAQNNWREQFVQTNKDNQQQINWSKEQLNNQNAWNLLNQGIYSDEIAEMLGLSKDVAKRYAEVAKKLVDLNFQ